MAADRLPDPAPGNQLCGLHQWPGDEGPCPVCEQMTLSQRRVAPVSAAVSPAEPPAEVPKPEVKRLCHRCLPKMYPGDEALRVIVSPNGTAHWGDYGKTDCGIDATGSEWWWPL